ncbi:MULTISPECIES: hydantoinase B/oxoprolinase family protein [unclassified Nitratiruptor]|uniref:hydantoinase B/oxoprolinase family protein n=1 Tax=unclassified Nitratiruptor TaxID=2624044 RepID=UPI00191602AA|nr:MULTISPECIES: hydantoinase B/oxoprolinase family protein [unclassified Nitratiruptor]BCD61050.1 5-oxoprolinase (ATP-hydrolysing) [Nitratiruptor sp. YY08-10]BCD64982.1 5-oxoprolinase (ATP-hydrolysing) [Nitratiruptor sp. YY08-14]
MIKIAIDRGGTFTDIYAIVNDEQIVTKKILSESPLYEDSNSYGIKLILDELGKSWEDIEWIRLGTTVATNALLERKGVDLTFLVTKGFKDILEIRYQNRSDLFALDIKKPKPLYKEVLEVDERIALQNGEPVVAIPLQHIPTPTYKHVAVMLLHSYLHPIHEQKIKEQLSGYEVTLSSAVIPLQKAIDRADTTVVDAYLTPVVRKYVQKILKGVEIDQKRILFIKSDGGLCAPEEFRGVNALLSGPAGGVVALSSIYKGEPLIGFDMGGTSTDVSRYDGKIELKMSDEVAGCNIFYPMVDIHTVAAGGGSRLFEKEGMFVVGPESSGSDPGPVCYGKNGFLSVSDANAVTGRLNPEFLPKIFGKSGKEPLDVEAAKEAFIPLAKKLGKSIEEVSLGFIDVANEHMANAIKEITIKKGYDPKEHTLCVFGGAGAQHAVGVARKLGIRKVFIHRHSGILSAVGIAYADVKKELVAMAGADIDKTFEILEQGYEDFQKQRSVFVRFKGTNNSIEVPYENYEEHFKKRYQEIFGFLPTSDIEIESVKVTLIKPSQKPKRPTISQGVMKPVQYTKVYFDEGWQDVPVFNELKADNNITGPALIALEHSTIVLDAKSKALIDAYGDIMIDVESKETRVIEAAKVALFANRLEFIAKKMGDILQKSARSVNIKERADFSCAIFDEKGDLIVNAPHIPVHLGSMSSVVKSIIAKGYKNATYITNAPYEGGSHLPDITIVTPYMENGKTLFWVASRGHHADIGGKVPGSMPAFSKFLHEEGAIIESLPIVENGVFYEQILRSIFESAGARNIEDNISDIKAQIAANIEGIKSLVELKEELPWFFEAIKAISKKSVEEFFDSIDTVEAEDYLDSGAKIALKVYKAEKIVFDFSASSPQLLGNQNAPFAVLRSAVLYAIRVMLQREIPLNDGLLQEIEIIAPTGTLLNPDKELAVVGGNVTTSQRIVDVIFKAFKVAAASQGCMNNVIIGNERFGYYETIAGGAGATPNGDGASGVHTHMTNTKITDVEVIESRFPMMIEEFSLRAGSGGDGKYKGGDGVKRVYRFLEPVELSLLTERRAFAPYGLAGGQEGKRGENYLIRESRTYTLGGKIHFFAKTGDRLIIQTPGGGGWGKRD